MKLAACGFVLSLVCCTHSEAIAQDAAGEDAAALLHEMVTYLGDVREAEFSYTTRLLVSGVGMEMKYWAMYEVSLRKPDRVSIRQTDGMPTASVFVEEDGLFIHIPMTDRYVQTSAPADLSEIIDQSADAYDFYWRLVVGPGLRTQLAGEPASLFEGYVESAEYVGRETAGEVSAHHLRLGEGDEVVDLWIAAEGAPRLLKARSSAPSEWAESGYFGEMDSFITMTFTDWQTPASIPEDRFTFIPPVGAERADTILEAYIGNYDFEEEWEEPEQVDLVGEDAPRFELPALGGGTFVLDDALKQHKVVILDFWATWCPPCRRGLPVLAELAAEQADNGVAVYAINLREEADEVEQFLEDQGLDLSVLLDEDGSIADSFGVTGIPQTVVIGQDGRIRAVHVGFDPGMKAELEREIEAAIAGEEIVVGHRAEGPAELPDAENLEQLWAIAGGWSSVAVDDADGISGGMIAGFGRSKIARISIDGEIQSEVHVSESGSTARLAQLDRDTQREYLVFGPWGRAAAIDGDGSKLWTAPGASGVDDVWAADLTGDGLDEVIVGYNGGTGVHVFGPDGTRLWKNTSIGNVWHVTAIDLHRDGIPEVVTTSAGGSVHVFDAESGRQTDSMTTPVYASMVRPGWLESDPMVLVGGGGLGQEPATVACLDSGGNLRWATTLRGDSIESLCAAKTRPWAASAQGNGSIHVIDLNEGTIIAHTNLGGRRPVVAWHEDGDEPVLLVANGQRLIALRVVIPGS